MNRQVKVCIRGGYTGITAMFSAFNVATQLLSASSQAELFFGVVWEEIWSGWETLSADKSSKTGGHDRPPI